MTGFDKPIGFKRIFWTLFFSLALTFPAQAQVEKEMIQALKKDPKGPFQAIKWFCPDGQILTPLEECPSKGGLQHGLLKETISRLEQEKQIYLDLVLAGAPHERIWDMSGHHSRIKQYALTKYLFLADDGWIYRQAQYYRGAIQAEDENDWGDDFLNWLLADPDTAARQFFQVREACRIIPHRNLNQNRLQTIRSVSKTLGDQIPGFMNLRVKIHGQPDSGDLSMVQTFMEKNKATFNENQIKLFGKLIENLESVYSLTAAANLEKLLAGKIGQLPELSDSIRALGQSIPRINEARYSFLASESNPYKDMADLLLKIRDLVLSVRPDIRLALMDFSLETEKTLFSAIGNWHPKTLADLMEKCRILATAAAGCGYMEMWEWDAVKSYGLQDSELKDPGFSMDFKQFRLKVEQIRRMVDWGTLMIRSFYLPEIKLYSQFEPMTRGFVDDRIRSSVLLPLGESVGQLTHFAQAAADVSHQLPEGIKPHGIRGLNPGLAHGILEVDNGDSTIQVKDSKKIYAFKAIPSELKPVAGMLTVSEGNLVSHVQLLARNLGLPNAVISSENLDSLMPYSGQKMFYAVSQTGSVVLKHDSLLTDQERALVQGRKSTKKLFRVPVEKINLIKNTLIPLSQVRAGDSGRICGPKAANLGQLKSLFPEQVVEGIVIPFGIFREHMDQVMPGLTITYWQFLTGILSTPFAGDAQLIEKLIKLQSAIKKMPFLPEFKTDMAKMFETTFGNAMGSVPVFIRSDTNMEDIHDFTGAGLNLTVFNVLDPNKLFQGIRDVWASPYGERSYLWRQKFLENPENVFPSILLLPSVNVDKSGVVITHGIVSNTSDDITVAFNRGVGGAVDGQTAETFLLTGTDTDILLYPARESMAVNLPLTGGVEKKFLLLDQPILTREDRLMIRKLVKTVLKILPNTPGIEGQGPFDIELGFINNSMRLFQVRPFVENKRASTLNYLLNLDKNNSEPKPILFVQDLTPEIQGVEK